MTIHPLTLKTYISKPNKCEPHGGKEITKGTLISVQNVILLHFC